MNRLCICQPYRKSTGHISHQNQRMFCFLWDSLFHVHTDKRKNKAVFFYLIISLAPPMEKPGWARNKRRKSVFMGWRKTNSLWGAVQYYWTSCLCALPTVNFSPLTWLWSNFFQHVWSTSSSMGWSEKDAWAKTSFVAVLRVTAKLAFSLQREIEQILL